MATYTFTDLSYPSATLTFAQGINDAGQIVGYAVDTYGSSHGFLYSNGNYTAVTGFSYGGYNYVPFTAQGISKTGKIVGTGIFGPGALTEGLTYYHSYVGQGPAANGFVYYPGVDPFYQPSVRTYAYGINNLGEVVGYYTNNSNPNGFVYSNGTYTSFNDPLGSAGTWARGINDKQQVVGYYVDVNGKTHGFEYNISNGGSYASLDDPLGTEGTFATGINNAGQIVGYYFDSNGLNHGFLYSGGSYVTIDDPAGQLGTSANGINNLGQIVGSYVDVAGNTHGFRASTETPPAVTPVSSNVSATHGQSFAASSLFTASDPDGDTITKYAFWDAGSGGGHFVLNGVAQGINQEIDVTAAQLTQLTYQSGSGADTLWVKANDGTLWSAWSSAFTVTGPIDTPPAVTPVSSNVSATHGQSFAASSLFTAGDPDGDTITKYAFWDTGSGGGHFVLNGVAQGINQEIDVTAAQLAQVIYQSGSGADTLWVMANDGSQWSAWSSAFTVTGPVDSGPVTTVSSVRLGKGQASTAASSLFSTSEADGDTVKQYGFWNTGAGGGHFLVNGVAQATNQEILVQAAQLAQVTYQAGSAADTLWVQANDGYVWGAWSNAFTVTPWLQTPPVVTVSNQPATHGQSFAASSLFAASDPDGDTITNYAFWDTGAGGGRFVLNGVAQGTNQEVDVTAWQVGQFSYQSGSGADTLWVRANDGTLWSAWSSAFTVTAPVDPGPLTTVSNVLLGKGQTSAAASSLFSTSEADGDMVKQYGFWDTGAGGGHFLVNGVAQATNQEIFVPAAQLAQVAYQAGSAADTLWVQANDGYVWGAWSNAFAVSPWVQTPPVVTASNQTATHGQSFAASSLFTASDPDGDTITNYAFWDTGAGGGHFVLNGVAQGTNQEIDVTAAQLGQLSHQSGSGADTLWVKANDGTLWSGWSSAFTVTAPIDAGPVETPTNPTIISVQGQSFAASSLFTYNDPFGSPATQYDFWDTGSGGGHFLLNGTPLSGNQDNIIPAAQLAQLTYQVGSGTDTLWVRANDGTVWGSWSSSFTVSDPFMVPAGATLELPSAFSGIVTYSGNTGTLKIDNSSSFSGTVGGQLAAGDIIDLTDVTAGATAKLTYSGSDGPGTLAVSDGTHTANISFIGDYSLASFTASSDGHGGTSIASAPAPAAVRGQESTLDQQMALLVNYMASSFPASGASATGLFEPEPANVSQQTSIAQSQHA
jgi:probable HAF family extracellular repeat protein